MIAWYVHHHWRGHAAHVGCVVAHLSSPVAVLSSSREQDRSERPADRRGEVTLERGLLREVDGGGPHLRPDDHAGSDQLRRSAVPDGPRGPFGTTRWTTG